MIMPTMMAMVFRIVPRDKIGGAMGVFGISLMVGPAIGPTLGGYLVEYVNWRWIFTINLPIGVVGILLAWFVLPDFKSKHPGKLDLGGAFSSGVMLFSLLLALSKGEDWGWTDERIVLLFAVSFFSFVLFLLIELTSKNPLLELRVFKYRSFMMANLLVVVTTVGMYAGIFYLPLFLQNVRGLGAMQTGSASDARRPRLGAHDADHGETATTRSAHGPSWSSACSCWPSSLSSSTTSTS